MYFMGDIIPINISPKPVQFLSQLQLNTQEIQEELILNTKNPCQAY